MHLCCYNSCFITWLLESWAITYYLHYFLQTLQTGSGNRVNDMESEHKWCSYQWGQYKRFTVESRLAQELPERKSELIRTLCALSSSIYSSLFGKIKHPVTLKLFCNCFRQGKLSLLQAKKSRQHKLSHLQTGSKAYSKIFSIVYNNA